MHIALIAQVEKHFETDVENTKLVQIHWKRKRDKSTIRQEVILRKIENNRESFSIYSI